MNNAASGIPQPEGGSGNSAGPTCRISRRAKWDIVLGIAGLVYVALILALNLSAPFFSLLLVGLVAFELLINRGARSARKPSGRP